MQLLARVELYAVVRDVVAQEARMTTTGGPKPEQRLDSRRLAGPIGAQQAEDGPARHPQRQAVHGGSAAIAHHQLIDLYCWLVATYFHGRRTLHGHYANPPLVSLGTLPCLYCIVVEGAVDPAHLGLDPFPQLSLAHLQRGGIAR